MATGNPQLDNMFDAWRQRRKGPQSLMMGTAQDLLGYGSPLLEQLSARSTGFLDGGMDVTNTPSYLAFKEQTGDQFARAKESIISSTPNGGGLTAALAGLEGDRASTLTRGAGDIYDDELARAMSLGTGVTGLGLSSLGGAAQLQAAKAAAEAQQSAAKAGTFGSGLGALLGGKK